MSRLAQHAWIGFGLSLLAALILTFDAWRDMVAIWSRSETFTHCFFIGPFSLYLIWRQRDHFRSLSPQLNLWALLSLLPIGLMYPLAGWVGVGVAQQFLAVLLIPLLVLAWFGARISWQIAFPLAYLLFMVPFGEALVPYLQDVTAVISVKLVELTGIPVYAEGHYIMLPSGSFQVAEACSGVRYLIASLAVGCLYAWLNYQHLYKRLLFIAAALLLPILANGLRAFGIMLLAHYSDFKLAVGFDHLIYGWLFFGLVIVALFWSGSLFWDKEPEVKPVTEVQSSGPYRLLPALVLSLLAILAPQQGQRLLEQSHDLNLEAIRLPASLANRSQDPSPIRWGSTFEGASLTDYADYQGSGSIVGAYLALYAQHDPNHQLVRSTHAVYNWQKAILLSNQIRSVNFGEVREELVLEGSQRVLYWSWYWLGQDQAASPVKAKLLQLKARLGGQPVDLVLSLRRQIQNDQDLTDARADFESLSSLLNQSVQSQLQQAIHP